MQIAEASKIPPIEANDVVAPKREPPEALASGNANTHAENMSEKHVSEADSVSYGLSEDGSNITPESIAPEILNQFLTQTNQTMMSIYHDTPFRDISLTMKEITVKGIPALRVFLKHGKSIAYFTLIPEKKSRNYTIISSESKFIAWAQKKMMGWAEKRTGWDAVKMRKLAEMATKKNSSKKKLNKVSDSGVLTI